MKLSFTTLACPDWTIDRVIGAAVENKYDAIDFRGYLDVVEIIDSPHFKGAALREMASRIRDAGLEVSCLGSSAHMTTPTDDDLGKQLDNMRRYAELCNALGCRQVRIFGGSVTDVREPDANAARNLARISKIARDAGVVFAIETHDVWTDTAHLRSVLSAAGDPDGVGLLWDLQHPWFRKGEKPEVSAANLSRGGKLCNTHWKDIVRSPEGKASLVLPGKGELPLAEMAEALSSVGYNGWLTLEWEKRWHPEIEDPETAIPAFAEFIRSLMCPTR